MVAFTDLSCGLVLPALYKCSCVTLSAVWVGERVDQKKHESLHFNLLQTDHFSKTVSVEVFHSQEQNT